MQTLRLKSFVSKGEACHVAAPMIADDRLLHVHRHDFLELFWVLRGRGIHWINDGSRELRPGILVLIRAEDAHTLGSADGSLQIVNIAFSIATWKYLQRRYFADKADLFSPQPIAQREFELTEARRIELQQAAVELRGGVRNRAGIERFLLNVRHILQPTDRTESSSQAPDWLIRACRAMERPENFNRGTRYFAQLAGRSPEHLSRALHKHLGKTPTDALNEHRMSHAAQRLATTEDTILDIVLDCGFENVSHFYKLFRTRFGTSPRRYRLRQKQIVGTR